MMKLTMITSVVTFLFILSKSNAKDNQTSYLRRRKASQKLQSLECDPSICLLEKGVGDCRGMHPRWYFNGEECNFFFYGGCIKGGGNANNFLTPDACQIACGNCAIVDKTDDGIIIGTDDDVFSNSNIGNTWTLEVDQTLYPSLSSPSSAPSSTKPSSAPSLAPSSVPSLSQAPSISLSPSLAVSSNPSLSPSLMPSTSLSPSYSSEDNQGDDSIETEEKEMLINDAEVADTENDSASIDLINLKEPKEKGLTINTGIMDGKEKTPKKEAFFSLTIHPQCILSPPSAKLRSPNRKVVLSTKKGENADKKIIMGCKDAELSGIYGLISEQNCPLIQNECPFSWSSLVGENGVKVKAIIQNEMPSNMKISIIEGNSSFVTSNHRKDRIRIFVDKSWNVIMPPQIG